MGAVNALTDMCFLSEAAEQYSTGPIMGEASAREAMPDVEALGLSLRHWRTGMEQHEVFKTPAGELLLDCFVDWLRSHPNETQVCLTKLEELSNALKLTLVAGAQAKAEADQAVVAAVRQWIARALEEPFKQQALGILSRLETELGLRFNSSAEESMDKR